MNRPCIIGVGLPPDDQQAIKSGLEYLHSLFNHVDGKQEKEGFNVLCAGPKNGLTYDEAFILCQRRFFEVGWVYADAAYEARS